MALEWKPFADYYKIVKRILEIDALRGIAILGMIVFHFFFDLSYFGVWRQEMFEDGWLVYARIAQFLFLGLVGVSIALSHRNFNEQFLRGLKIFLCGMLVTLVTFFFAPQDFVKFGVLHFIGVAVPIVYLFKGKKKLAILTAVFAFLIGRYFGAMTTNEFFLFPFGITRADFSSLDYFPIFPWLAVSLVGLVIGEILYGHGKARIPALGKVKALVFLGKHSLLIYLVHQPILILLILSTLGIMRIAN
jgi:uncharacterized membrane protein